MTLLSTAERSRLSVGIAILCILPAALMAAEEPKIYTQKPEVAISVVTGKTAAPAAKPAAPKVSFSDGPNPVWIWGPKSVDRYILKTEFTGGSKGATLRTSCDNGVRISINGKQVVSSDEWQEPAEADIQQHILPGKNEIIAEVSNDGGPAAFVFKLVLTMPDGSRSYVVSDTSWKAAETRDAAQWVPARQIAKLGDGPWGDVLNKPASLATAKRGIFELPPGFKIERLFTVPKDELGSWVSITFDDKGRLIASDQGKEGLFRITPPPLDGAGETKVERLKVDMSGAHGLLHAFGSLYVTRNESNAGLYRLRDTNGDDQYDEVTKLKSIRGGGEHGPHGLRLSPDGKSIVMVAGNHTLPPENFDASRVPKNWAEDHLLPRMWDANGHARGILAPGGWIAKTDPDGKRWEIISSGYRNTYDIAYNQEGELFAYDSDMEWDMGMPWYRPTRAVHATGGSELGWRSGTGKWPAYYVDSLPPLTDIGPGSPVGVTFGYGAKFPAKYQKALYLCDWTFGTIYALFLEPSGSTYKAVKEEFVSRSPLPLTDSVIGPDGAFYFTVGGRGTQSELFRVTYVGNESTAPADLNEPMNLQLRQTRRKLEALHEAVDDPAKAVAEAYPYLSHDDRFIRYAARVALEHQPAKLWQDKVLTETNAEALITGAVALAHQGDKALESKLLAALDRLDFGALSENQKLELLRVWSLVFLRMGEPEKATAAKLAAKLDTFYPAGSDSLNRELCTVLIYLKSETVVAKTIAQLQKESVVQSEDISSVIARNPGYGGSIAQMLAARPDAQKIHYAFMLRNATVGWNLELRKAFFDFLTTARQWKGGASYQGFLKNIDNEAFENAPESERLAIEATGARRPYKAPELPKPTGPGHEWTKDEVVAAAESSLTKGRSFKNGQTTFAAARCVVCHRFGGDGGATGPDLTQAAGRFGVKDLAEAILEPSKIVSDQYRASIIATSTGQIVTGKVVNDTGKTLIVVTDPEDSSKVMEISKDRIDEIKPSTTSLMPEKLLDALNKDEVLDLLAYILSRGNSNDPMFKK